MRMSLAHILQTSLSTPFAHKVELINLLLSVNGVFLHRASESSNLFTSKLCGVVRGADAGSVSMSGQKEPRSKFLSIYVCVRAWGCVRVCVRCPSLSQVMVRLLHSFFSCEMSLLFCVCLDPES